MSERLAILRLDDSVLLPGERISWEVEGEPPLFGERVFVVPERPDESTGDPLRGTIARLVRRNDTLFELAGVRRGRMREETLGEQDQRETAEVDEIGDSKDPERAAYLRAALDELATLDHRSGISKGMFDELGDDASLLADIVALVLQLSSEERLALLDLEDPAARVRGAAARIDEARSAARERHDRRHKGDGATRVRAVLDEFARGNLAYGEMEAIPVEDAETVDALIAGLSEEQWRAVMACTRQLGHATAARERATAALRMMLDHPEGSVQQAAVKSLGLLGPAAAEAAPEILAKLLQRSDLQHHGLYLRECFEALGGIGGAAAAREVAAFVACCLPAPSAFHGLAAYRASRNAAPGDVPEPPDYAKPAEEVYDGFDLLSTAASALARMHDARELAAPALREIVRSPRSGEKARSAAIRGLVLLERDEASVSNALDAIDTARAGSNRLWEPGLLDAFFEAGAAFPLVVRRLVTSGATGSASYQDPTPALARFVAHDSFGDAGIDALHALLAHADARVRTEAAELGGFVRDPARLLPALREGLADADRGAALAAASALTRLRDAAPGTQQRLRDLLARVSGDPAAEDAIRDSLAILGAPVPTPAGESAAERALGFFPLPGAIARESRIDGTTIFVAWHENTPHPDPSKWSTDADRMGITAIDLTSAAASESRVPLELPMKPTGASGAKRRFTLHTRLPEGWLVSIDSPFSDHRGWGSETFLLVFDPAAKSWSWLTPDASASGYTLAWIDGTEKELPSRAAAGGELILWMEGTRLRVESDATPYHLEDSSPSPETMTSLTLARAWRDIPTGAKAVEGVSAHRWLCDGAVVRDVRRYVLEHDPRVAADELASLEPRCFFSAGKTLALLISARLTDGTHCDSVLVLR